MQNNNYDNCKICGESIKKGYLTQWKDGDYYCAKCQVDLNRNIEYKTILKRRKYELKHQLMELEIELGESDIIEIMYC